MTWAEESSVQRKTAFFTTGAGLAASIGDASLFIASDITSPPAHELLALFRQSAVGARDSVAVVRALARVVAQHGFETVPPFACVIVGDGDPHGIVYGELQATVRTTHGEEILDGSQAITWVDRRFEGSLISFAVGEPVEPGTSWFFADGMVPASGMVVSAPIESVSPPAVNGAAARVDDILDAPLRETVPDVIDLTEAVAPPPPPPPSPVEGVPLPPPPPPPPPRPPVYGSFETPSTRPVSVAETRAVAGMVCVNGHLNRPDAVQCEWCVAELDRGRGTTIGARPSLGVLAFDDGTRIDLARPIIVGASPPTDVVIAGEDAQTVIIDADLDGVSDTQFEVHLESWDVFVIDRSTTGTFLDDANGRRHRLPRHARVKLRPGSVIAFGDHLVRVEPARHG
jgi:hypothetical protein